MHTLLVIDDDVLLLQFYRTVFQSPTIRVVAAETAGAGIAAFEERRPDAVIIDVHLPDMSGLLAFARLHALDARVPIIVATGDPKAATAIEAMRLGALDYLVKPLVVTTLKGLVARAFEISRLMRVPVIVPEVEPDHPDGDPLIGGGPQMQAVFKTIGRVAGQDVTVLVRGESGTGKELVARAIYHYSRRATGPFLAINCAAIPDQLLESELFGYEKGAFTGAERRRIGKFEQCHGGSLFLDEVGDMSQLTQTKVLRVLQDRRFERVGGTESIQADVRLIAATNRDLEQMIADGQFRSDLYYRLNVVTIHLPPLRDRPEDIPMLARHFLRRYAAEMGKEVTTISDEATDCLCRFAWPGNVRELQSVIKQALLHGTGPAIGVEHLPAFMAGRPDAVANPADALARAGHLSQTIDALLATDSPKLFDTVVTTVERLLLESAMRHTAGNQSEAARVLGISRSTLRIKLSFHHL